MNREKQAPPAHTIGPIRRFFITADGRQLGLFFGLWTFVIFFGSQVLRFGLTSRLVPLFVINLGIWIVGGQLYGQVLDKQFKKRDEQLGLALTKQDRLDLFQWIRYGVKPTSERLQPILPHYLDYLQRQHGGKIGTHRLERLHIFRNPIWIHVDNEYRTAYK